MFVLHVGRYINLVICTIVISQKTEPFVLILGNRDGEVLDDPESFKTKEESKLGVLEVSDKQVEAVLENNTTISALKRKRRKDYIRDRL